MIYINEDNFKDKFADLEIIKDDIYSVPVSQKDRLNTCIQMSQD